MRCGGFLRGVSTHRSGQSFTCFGAFGLYLTGRSDTPGRVDFSRVLVRCGLTSWGVPTHSVGSIFLFWRVEAILRRAFRPVESGRFSNNVSVRCGNISWGDPAHRVLLIFLLQWCVRTIFLRGATTHRVWSRRIHPRPRQSTCTQKKVISMITLNCDTPALSRSTECFVLKDTLGPSREREHRSHPER